MEPVPEFHSLCPWLIFGTAVTLPCRDPPQRPGDIDMDTIRTGGREGESQILTENAVSQKRWQEGGEGKEARLIEGKR